MDLGAIAAQAVAAIKGQITPEAIIQGATSRTAWVLKWRANTETGEGGQVVVREWKVASETRLAVGEKLTIRGVPVRVASCKYTEFGGVHYLSVAEGD